MKLTIEQEKQILAMGIRKCLKTAMLYSFTHALAMGSAAAIVFGLVLDQFQSSNIWIGAIILWAIGKRAEFHADAHELAKLRLIQKYQEISE